MNVVTTTAVFPEGYPQDVAVDRLAKVGFTHLDAALSYCIVRGAPFLEDSWRDWAKSLRAKADGMGIRFTHAHACSSPDYLVHRCFEACEILGVRYMVIHPTHEVNGEIFTDDEKFIAYNAEIIRGFLPYAQRHGVVILTENLLWGSTISPLTIADLVRAVDSPYFGWCLDTGHMHCCGVPMTDLRGVSVPPLSLHVQDNHGVGSGDQHLLPGDGTIDWKEFLDILKEIGYEGDLVLEAHHQSLDAPDEEREPILADLYDRAVRMRDYFSM
jgi:sugar phosphate isomerase/epimerase